MNWRYFGQMTSPENKTQVFLSRGDQTVGIDPGQRLDDGFIVEAVTAESVRLRHVDSGAKFVITLPDAAAPGQQ